MKRILAICLSLCAMPSLAESPIADVICDSKEAMSTKLEEFHGARKLGSGLRGPDAILEIWTVPQTGEWTMVQSYANGIACIVAMGEHWDRIDPAHDPA